MHSGVRIVAGEYYGEWMTQIISELGGVHEPQEEVVFHSLLDRLPPDATMVEIGAYWSYYTLWFMSHSPSTRRGIAVEPDLRNLRVGQVNADLNELRLEYIQAFISEHDIPRAKFQGENSGALRVDGLSIATIFQRANLNRADLILCDAQGGEIPLLRGIRDLVEARRVGIVVLSTHSHHITGDPLTHQRALGLIGGLGGKVRMEHDVQESYSGDGLIVADFDNSLDGWECPKISRNRCSHSLFRDPLWDLAKLQSTRSWKLTHPLRWVEAKISQAITLRSRHIDD
jgi:FkbM family methyltransferase